MVEVWGRFGRRNGEPLPPVPDLDPTGAVGAAEASGEGEQEGRRRRRARELGERGRRQGEEREGEGVGTVRERVGLGSGRKYALRCEFFLQRVELNCSTRIYIKNI